MAKREDREATDEVRSLHALHLSGGCKRCFLSIRARPSKDCEKQQGTEGITPALVLCEGRWLSADRQREILMRNNRLDTIQNGDAKAQL